MDKLRPCSACGHPVARSAKKCPKCGEIRPWPFNAAENIWRLSIIGVLFAAMPIAALLASGGDGSFGEALFAYVVVVVVGLILVRKAIARFSERQRSAGRHR